MAVRSPQRSVVAGLGGEGTGTTPVDAHRPGNSSALPGVVTQVCPSGSRQITVPSGSCSSRQPQNVFSK